MLAPSQARGDLIIANWSFPDNGTVTPPINASSSTDTTGTPVLGGTLFTAGATPSYVNDQSTGALRFDGTPAQLNAQTLTLSLTVSGNFSFVALTYSTTANQNNDQETWAYSINGGSSTALGSVTAPNGGLQVESLSFSQAVTDGEQIVFTCTISGTSGGDQTLDFANVTLTAVPEPITNALAVFGLVFVGGSAGRFCLGRRRSNAAG